MPYISTERQTQLPETGPLVAGDLNFLVTKLCLNYLPTTPRYQDYNEVIGVLECAKLEFYRRAVAKYEDEAIQKNGDVYE